MNIKKWIITSIVVSIGITIIEMIGHGYILVDLYKQTANLWRTEEAMNNLMPIGFLVTIITSFIFVYIYDRGYEGKGSNLFEGIRFGLVIGLFVSIPMSVWSYISMPMPIDLAIGWFITALTKFIIAGGITGILYSTKELQ